MNPRNRSAPRASHDRWLVSYADFITLLFALFVVLFATGRADRGSAKRISESVRTALEHGGLPTAIRQALAKPGRPARPSPATAAAALEPSRQFLARELAPELASGKVQVSMEARGLVISLKEAAFFPSGESTVYPRAYPTIRKLARAMCTLPNAVRLEGHTDTVPIHNSRFHSNWDLSAARAIAVLDLLRARFGLSGTRFAIAGYADTLPLETNKTPAGRARNRRVDIVILNEPNLSAEGPERSE